MEQERTIPYESQFELIVDTLRKGLLGIVGLHFEIIVLRARRLIWHRRTASHCVCCQTLLLQNVGQEDEEPISRVEVGMMLEKLNREVGRESSGSTDPLNLAHCARPAARHVEPCVFALQVRPFLYLSIHRMDPY